MITLLLGIAQPPAGREESMNHATRQHEYVVTLGIYKHNVPHAIVVIMCIAYGTILDVIIQKRFSHYHPQTRQPRGTFHPSFLM